MFPITPRRIDEGLIVGLERVVTKRNGSAWYPSEGGWEFNISGSTWANRNPLRWSEMEYHAHQEEVAVVVQTFELGLLTHSRNFTMLPHAGIRVIVNPGQVAVISRLTTLLV